MKIIITESKYKNILFRYWNKNGGAVDKTFISLFGLDNNRDLTYDQAYKYLIEWRGEKQAKELAKTLLLKNPHHVDDFGGYDFFFEVTDIRNWRLNDDEPNVVVKVKVDDLGGSVTLMDGDHKSLEDALDNEDYGWEIGDEVNWGVNEYFKDNITSQTGIYIIFDSVKYSSRIFNINT
jgi:hypothetical protein